MEPMMTVCLYRDSTGLFTEAGMANGNLCDIVFPERIVRAWYKAHEKDFIAETCDALQIPESEADFDKWFYDVSTAYDTDGLYQFSIELGFTPREFHCY